MKNILILFLYPGCCVPRSLRMTGVAWKLDSRDIKIISKCFISRLSCFPATPVILSDRGTRQPGYTKRSQILAIIRSPNKRHNLWRFSRHFSQDFCAHHFNDDNLNIFSFWFQSEELSKIPQILLFVKRERSWKKCDFFHFFAEKFIDKCKG